MRSFTLKPERLSKAEQKRADKAAYNTVAERSQGICEGCGIRPASDMHHRLYRSRGGATTPDNLLHLCGGSGGMSGGNHSGCHGKAHTLLGEQLGWSVLSTNDPTVIPVFHKASQSWTQNGEPIMVAVAVEIMVTFGQLAYGLEAVN